MAAASRLFKWNYKDWKWRACVGAFVIHFIIGGLMNSGGVLMSALVDKFKSKRGETAWVSALSASCVYFFAPISTSVCRRYGCRTGVAIGLFLCTVSLVTSSFVNNLFALYFTYGLLWGCGACMIYFPAFITVSWHFKQSEHAFANGLAMSGGSLGTMALSPLAGLLFKSLGVDHTFRVFLAFHAALVIPLFVFRPISVESSGPTIQADHPKMFNWSILKNYGYLALITGLFIFMILYLVPYVHLVRLAEDLGATKTQSSLLISYLSLSSFASRLLFGKISDLRCCNRLLIFQSALLTIGVATTLLSIAPSYPWLVLYSIIFGLAEGCYMTLNAVIHADIVGKEKLPSALGLSYFLMSFPRTMGPPVAGWVFDAFNSYAIAFLFMGGMTILSVLAMFLIPVLNKRTTNEKREELILKEDELLITPPSTTLVSDLTPEKETSV